MEYADVLATWLALGAADLGERTAQVGALLLSRYDIFLPDGPTTDLDLDGLKRLERFVTGLRAATVLVSHDREFLARTVTQVVELDLAQQRVSVFGGGYERYLREREVDRQHLRDAYDACAGTVEALSARARTQRLRCRIGELQPTFGHLIRHA